MAVHDGTWQYIFQSITVYGSTWRYIDWICCGILRLGRWPGRFWCAFESAALHAQSVAIASSHCMHKLVYSSSGTLASASPDTILFASRSCFGRDSRLASRQWDRRRLPRGDPGPTCGRRNLSRRGGRRRQAGGRRPQEGRQQVVAKRRLRRQSWWFLVPDVGTGDRVDDETENVELHDTSCVCQFANRNDKFRINKPSNRHPGSRQ